LQQTRAHWSANFIIFNQISLTPGEYFLCIVTNIEILPQSDNQVFFFLLQLYYYHT